MDELEIQRLSDRELVQRVFDEYFGRYQLEGHTYALLHAQLKELEEARDILAWNPLKKLARSGQVAEARGRLRGWLYHRLSS